MVQVESMACGTPVISTDLPGVRQPIKMTGMGRIVPPRDPGKLSKALIEILSDPNGYQGDPELVKSQFSPDAIAAQYESLFSWLLQD